MFIANNWVQYSAIQACVLFATTFLLTLSSSFGDEAFDSSELISKSGGALLITFIIAVFVFSLFEKTFKERFVLNLTNERSRKQLMQILNNSKTMVVIVARNGQILFYNEQFQTMVTDKLDYKNVPTNFVSLTEGKNCAESNTANLQTFIRDFFMQEEVLQDKCQMFFCKNQIDQTNGDKKLDEGNPNQQVPSSDVVFFSALGTLVKFKGENAVALTLQNTSLNVAQQMLMCLHSSMLTEFISKFNNKIEHLLLKEQKQAAGDTGSFEETLTEAFGNQFLLLNSLRQLHFQLDLSNKTNKPTDFLFSGELNYCIDGISVNLNEQTQIKYIHDESIPEDVNGDKETFRLALLTLAEFAIKFNSEGTITLHSKLEWISEDRTQYKIMFSFVMNKSPQEHLNKTLEKLVNNKNFYQPDESDEKYLVKRFIKNFEFVKQFGLGMILFPSIVKRLGGVANVGKPSTFEAGARGADITSFSNTMTDRQNMLKIKYFCMVNLSDASQQIKVQSPYKAINSQLVKTGRESIWKSPLNRPDRKPV